MLQRHPYNDPDELHWTNGAARTGLTSMISILLSNQTGGLLPPGRL
jgi:hypothetical protein